MKHGNTFSNGMVYGLFAVILLVGPAPASAEVIRHDLAVALHPDAQKLVGVDNVTVQLHGISDLSFRLKPDARIVSVIVGEREAPFDFEGGVLRVSVPKDVTKEEVSLAITYEATFRDPVPENPISTEDPGYGVSGVILPKGAFLLPQAGWYPHVPGSHASFLVRVDAPEGIEAVTAGRLVDRRVSDGRISSTWEIDHPIPGISLSAGPYVIKESRVNDIPLYAYLFPETEALADAYLEAAGEYIGLYRQLFGPYPFAKFAVVENFFPTGYGFPSYTLLGSQVIRLPFIVETSLGHEVAHSWWGNSVFVDNRGGNWSEGLTTYVADYLYKERSSSEEARSYRMRILRNYATLVSPEDDFPLNDFTGRTSPATRTVGYGKGAMVFHMIRGLIGDDAFWRGLRELYATKRFQTAQWDDFAGAFGAAGGKDLRPFLRQWVHRPGAAVIGIDAVESRRTRDGWRVTGTLFQQEPFYDLNIPVTLETDAGEVRWAVRLNAEKGTFTMDADARPKKLAIDPEADIFRRLYPEEIPPDVNAVRGSQSLVVVRSRSLASDAFESARMLLHALGRSGETVLLEEEITVSRLRGHDVLFLGLPQRRELLPGFPEEMALEGDRFVVNGATYAERGDALFVALLHPSDKDRTVAVFLPLSAQAAGAAARKIPHYGSYSLLVFREGENRVKRVWTTENSPLVHLFRHREKAQ